MTGKTQMATKKKYETILVDTKDGITWVTFNRPDQRNAMSPQLHMEMDDVLDDLAIDPKTEVLVITGAGKAFSAGQDIKLYFRGTASDPAARQKARRASNQWRWQKLSTFPKPTIAMVNGFCFGGAFTPLIACDLAIAAEDATFGLSEINWGIFPGGLVSRVIVEAMGYRDALYYSLTGQPFDGRQAAQIGLVNKAVPRERLREETLALAGLLLDKNPEVLRATKQVIKTAKSMDYWQAEDYMMAKMFEMRARDKDGGRDKGIAQFIDEKSFRPGFGAYRRGE
jgi:trans-feruloyl-CoA hydratase/vanillin synthase